MYYTTARILDRIDDLKVKKLEDRDRRMKLWNSFLAGIPKVLDTEPQNFGAYCARFKAAYELIGK